MGWPTGLNLPPGQYRAWEDRTGRAHPVTDDEFVSLARAELRQLMHDPKARPDHAEHLGAAAETAKVDRLTRSRLDVEPVEPVESESRGPLSLRLRLWWMRRILAWQLRGLHDGPEEPNTPAGPPTYRRRTALLHGALSCTVLGSSVILSARMILGLQHSLIDNLLIPWEVFGVIMVFWLLPMRWWRADRPRR